MQFPFPPPDEQSAIVRFLDHADRRIRRYVSAKRRLIGLLNEQKQAVIHRAVTRGLDPHARMKPSGVEWLGEVPEHWELRRLKHVARMESGENITGLQIEPIGSYPVLGGNGLRGYTDKFTHEGHFALIGRQGALCGNVNYIKGKFWASEHAIVPTLRAGVSVEWFGELIRSMNLKQYSQAAAQPGLSVEMISNLQIPFPPPSEQSLIVAGMTNQTQTINIAKARAEKEISLLREYHTRLIADVVTGKLDVRQAAALLPDEQEPPPTDESLPEDPDPDLDAREEPDA